MPTVEIIQKGLPNEVQILVKVPHWHLDQGRVYWQKKVNKELFLPLVNLLDNGYFEKDKDKLQQELKELRDSANELESQKKKLENDLKELNSEKEKLEKAHKKFLEKIKL